MIISEYQIMQLINLLKDYSVILSMSSVDSAAQQYNRIRDLLDEIANQQSDKPMEIKNTLANLHQKE